MFAKTFFSSEGILDTYDHKVMLLYQKPFFAVGDRTAFSLSNLQPILVSQSEKSDEGEDFLGVRGVLGID